jgi:ATP-dependent Lon protease
MLPLVDRVDVIPLFPLPLVVLPGEVVPLHIFEERYKAMIADCRQGGGAPSPFGIALARGKEVHAAGCTVSILEVMREYDDGRLDIVTVGQTRFRVRELFHDRPYHTAAVEYFGDRDEPVEPALRRRAIDAFDRLGRATSVPGAGAAIAGERLVSYRIGAGALADPLDKQHLLELTSENERLGYLVEALERLIAEQAEHNDAQRLAGSNGKLRTLRLP